VGSKFSVCTLLMQNHRCTSQHCFSLLQSITTQSGRPADVESYTTDQAATV
jgi:hypothetical protein